MNSLPQGLHLLQVHRDPVGPNSFGKAAFLMDTDASNIPDFRE